MNPGYLNKVLTQNDHKNIFQISTTSLIRILFCRVQEGSMKVDVDNCILSYIDKVNGRKYYIDTVDVNGIVTLPGIELKE